LQSSAATALFSWVSGLDVWVQKLVNQRMCIPKGRNQDYPPPFTLVMVHYIFMRKGKVLYQGTSYAGTIGLSTAASAAQGGLADYPLFSPCKLFPL